MPSKIYRSPVDRQPQAISDKTVTGALLPATFVTEGQAAFTQATAFGPGVRLLANRDFYSSMTSFFNSTDPLLTAYASGETGVAFVLEPGQTYMGAIAAATYTWGQELTVGAAGRLVAAATGNVVVGYYRSAPGAKLAGDLVDFEVANHYTKA